MEAYVLVFLGGAAAVAVAWWYAASHGGVQAVEKSAVTSVEADISNALKPKAPPQAPPVPPTPPKAG